MTEPLDNIEVLKNLLQQKAEMDKKLDEMRATYMKVVGAIEALEQIEATKLEEGEVLLDKLRDPEPEAVTPQIVD